MMASPSLTKAVPGQYQQLIITVSLKIVRPEVLKKMVSDCMKVAVPEMVLMTKWYVMKGRRLSSLELLARGFSIGWTI